MNCKVEFPTLDLYTHEISKELNRNIENELKEYSVLVEQKFNKLGYNDEVILDYDKLTGIDIPILLSPVGKESKGVVMIVGESPLRNKALDGLIIRTPFAIGTRPECYRQCNRYKKIIQNIIDKGYSVYITDIIKIWDTNKSKKLTVSGFDKKILKKEHEHTNALKIICWGKKSFDCISKFINSKDIIHTPHPSAMATRWWKKKYPTRDWAKCEESITALATEEIIKVLDKNFPTN